MCDYRCRVTSPEACTYYVILLEEVLHVEDDLGIDAECILGGDTHLHGGVDLTGPYTIDPDIAGTDTEGRGVTLEHN